MERKFEYYHDKVQYSDKQFLMEYWMHCVRDVTTEITTIVARCSKKDEAELIVRLLNNHYKEHYP